METPISHHVFSSPASSFDSMVTSSNPPTFLKLEDLHNSPVPSHASEDGNMSLHATPPPVIVQSKPAKKRKSWGQELPEPTTNLPPRKRAKTDDEKEQRRIERIKRNRAAAHNSRERKRQETETLAVALARVQAELDAYRKHFGALPSNIILPEVTLCTDENAATPAPSLIESHGTVDATSSPPGTPSDTLFDYPVTIKEEEPTESTLPTIPPAFEFSEAKPALAQPLDLTQHSAEMLCDLPCRSSHRSASNGNTTNNNPASSLPPSFWTTLFLYLLTAQLQTGYKTLLLALWTHSPSRITARLTTASTRRSTSPSTTSSTTTLPLLSRSMWALAQLPSAATSPVSPALGALSVALQRSSSSWLEAQRLEGQAAAVRLGRSCCGEEDGMALDEGNGEEDLREGYSE